MLFPEEDLLRKKTCGAQLWELGTGKEYLPQERGSTTRSAKEEESTLKRPENCQKGGATEIVKREKKQQRGVGKYRRGSTTSGKQVAVQKRSEQKE